MEWSFQLGVPRSCRGLSCTSTWGYPTAFSAAASTWESRSVVRIRVE
jgi:hypothetical protein